MVLAKISFGCFPCRVNAESFADSVKRAHCGADSNFAHSCAELFTLLVGVIGGFCRENPTGRGLLDKIQENH